MPWQNLHLTFISVTVKCWANLCLSSITPSMPETLCLVQSSIFPPSVFFLEGEKHLSFSKLWKQSHAIRAHGREMCAKNSQGAESFRLCRFSFPLSGFQKQRNSREKSGQDLTPSHHYRCYPHLPFSLFLSLSHTCTHARTHHGNLNTKMHSRANSDFMQPSRRQTHHLSCYTLTLNSYPQHDDKKCKMGVYAVATYNVDR